MAGRIQDYAEYAESAPCAPTSMDGRPTKKLGKRLSRWIYGTVPRKTDNRSQITDHSPEAAEASLTQFYRSVDAIILTGAQRG